MTFVWKHPSLTGLELLWRWLAAVPLLALAWHLLAPGLGAIPLNTVALAGMTFFEPVRSVRVLVSALRPYIPVVATVARWWIPLAVLVWVSFSALGRTAILRRSSPYLDRSLGLLFGFRVMRALAFLSMLALWASMLAAVLHFTIVEPGQHGAEPNIVLFTAAVVALTLAVFMLWSLTVWLLDLPPLRSMAGLLTTPSQGRELRSKLIELNLVMGIVRVALFVLAMTFSASPLPFQTRETQAYINVWWVGVAAFYVLSSDFFHVVRYVTYLRLLESLARPSNVHASPAS